MIVLKRAYEPPSSRDGYRVLVERLWPRGVSKDTLKLDSWEKEIAPSTTLRKWYAHDPAKWDEFVARYTKELSTPEAQEALNALAARARRGRVTLIFAAHDAALSNATVLKQLIDRRLKRKSAKRS
jgi:uncharacterized protein YeaO (DUF488 family)